MGSPAPDRRAESDDRARVIEEHLPLVEAIARRHARGGEPLDDLVQAGCIGLIKAVDRFDPARGTALRPFASAMIDGEIRHHLRDRRRRASREAPEAPEHADGPDESHEHAEARDLLARGWHVLAPRERRLLELRYVDDLTQAEIARRVGLSQAQVSRLLRAALDRLGTQLAADVAPVEDRAYGGDEMATPEVQPEQRPTHSGRLLVRMPPSLHAELARAAEREGVSLNSLVIGALAGAVGWRDGAPPDPEDRAPGAPATEPGTDRRRWLTVALAANFAVVALAAVLAIVLLVIAWQGG
jgi:RNA polymerase sigma factor (sigma-70 family)